MLARLDLLAAVAVALSPTLSLAQAPAVAQRDAMKKLDFLVGEWTGEGWMESAPGQRRTFRGTEVVQSKLEGLLLTIEGVHRSRASGKDSEGVVHSAFAVVSYDEQAKRYRFRAYTARGNHEDTEAEVADGQLVWGMTVPQFGKVRYTITRDDKGRWFEVGEVAEDGKAWRKFFEMTLEPVKPK
jgi:hypothetical protein